MHWMPLFLSLVMITPCVSRAQVDEKERLSGFAEHHRKNRDQDREREKGLKTYQTESSAWEAEREKAKKDYKRDSARQIMLEDGPEAKADTKEKQIYEKEMESFRREYVSKKTKQDLFSREKLGLPSEEVELDMFVDRPRVDYKQRAAYGAQPNYSKMPVTGSRGSSGGTGRFGGGSSGGGGDYFPPPPSMDYEDAYVPAPNFEGEGDVEPPPPPPFPEEFDGPEGGDDFIPPPPPPPPGFGDVEVDPIETDF